MTQYFRVDGQRLTYAEYWRMSPGFFSFAIAAAMKLVRMPIASEFAIPRIDELTFVDPKSMPPYATHALAKFVRACLDADLRPQFTYTMPSLDGSSESYSSLFLSEDGRTAAQLIFVRSTDMEKTAIGCLTRLGDRRFLVTTDQPEALRSHPDDDMVRLVGRPPQEILARHAERLAAMTSGDRSPIRLDENSLKAMILYREQGHIDYHVSRGVYVPIDPECVDD